MTFATSHFLIRDRVTSELRQTVFHLQSNHPDIHAVYLFGSFASGVPTPRSDVDLLIVAQTSNWEDLQAEFLSVAMPVDCYVVRPDVFEQRSRSGKGVVGTAVLSGIRLL
jgi:predicted nucleotidyltransferase